MRPWILCSAAECRCPGVHIRPSDLCSCTGSFGRLGVVYLGYVVATRKPFAVTSDNFNVTTQPLSTFSMARKLSINGYYSPSTLSCMSFHLPRSQDSSDDALCLQTFLFRSCMDDHYPIAPVIIYYLLCTMFRTCVGFCCQQSQDPFASCGTSDCL